MKTDQSSRTSGLSRFPATATGLFAVLLLGCATTGGAQPRSFAVYSFHGTLRCSTCLLVEQKAEAAVRNAFAAELVGGSLAWRSVNIRLPENRHFGTDYQIASWGLVLVEYLGQAPRGWKNLALAGELVRADPDAFRRYVTAEVRAFLDNKQQATGEIR